MIESRKCIEGKTALFLNPLYKRLYACPADHQYQVVEIGEDQVQFRCVTCGKVTYQGYDPYREANVELINLFSNRSDVYPFVYLTLSDNTMQKELDFYESHYSNKFYGIKVHPNLCRKKVLGIHFASAYPIIVHCGMTEFDSPRDVIQFALRYPGKVILAHLARCDKDVLELVAKADNIYVDTSPTYLPFQIAAQRTGRYYPSVLTNVDNVTQLFENLIAQIGCEKIIFGSDAPWGNDEEAIKLYNAVDIPEDQKRRIFQSNFESIIK